MIRRVLARAYSNIALIKYWGKAAGAGNLPATPSISLALRELATETEVERSDSDEDQLILNGLPAAAEAVHRVREYLNYWREIKLLSGFFLIRSRSNFPTGAGLASSASGFASLTSALSGFSDREMGTKELSRLARRGSGSAARSITGGLSALPLGKNPAARLLLPADEIPWGMVVVVIADAAKEISSRQGMKIVKESSPYYSAWVELTSRDYRRMLKVIRNQDFIHMGELAEANALAMHSCMIASRPSLFYWSVSTVQITSAVWEWRKQGLQVFFTIDAGPNVVLIGKLQELPEIAARARTLPGVARVIPSAPGGGAEVLSLE